MTLRSFVGKHPCDKVLVVSASGEWTVDRIFDGPEAIQNAFSGTRIAISISDAGMALRILVALDGIAETIVLLASSMAPDSVGRLSSLARCDFVIADNPGFIIETCGIPDVYPNMESIRPLSEERQPPKETAWLLTTSGTTGNPKLVSHTLASLMRTTKIDPIRGADLCWGLLYDYTRFAGLQVFLQSVLSGSKLIAPETEVPLEEKLKAFICSGCTHLSATPTMWRKITMTPGSEALPLRQVTLGGEIADDRILAMLSATYRSARVTHIYASTEAGVGFSVTDRRAGFPEAFLKCPPAGISLRVVDGCLQIKNEMIDSTYVGTDISFGTNDGWINTGDNVAVSHGRVLFLGRDSGLINVGGNKVHPEEVERVLLMHPEVTSARASGKFSPITGALVVAEVVLKAAPTDPTTIRDDLKAFAATMLEKHKVPVIINIVSNIESNSAGKIVRGKP